MRGLPNAISCFRIILSLLLPVLAGKGALFTVAYFLCGVSDVADGYIARRWKIETRLGAKLDSLADLIFCGGILFAIIFYKDIEITILVAICCIIVAAIRVMNAIITKRKFRQWGIIHTLGNKATGFTLFLAMPIWIWVGHIPYAVVIPVGIIAIFSSLEETFILLTSQAYDANRKSIFL